MKTIKVPETIVSMVLWDEIKAKYFFMLALDQPIDQPRGVSKSIPKRYRVEIRPEGYAVLIPQ